MTQKDLQLLQSLPRRISHRRRKSDLAGDGKVFSVMVKCGTMFGQVPESLRKT